MHQNTVIDKVIQKLFPGVLLERLTERNWQTDHGVKYTFKRAPAFSISVVNNNVLFKIGSQIEVFEWDSNQDEAEECMRLFQAVEKFVRDHNLNGEQETFV